MSPDDLTDAILYEALELWPAYTQLHTHLLSTDPRTSDPRDLVGPLMHYGTLRAACLLHAHCIGCAPADSAVIVGHLMALAQDGQRPRYGTELGLTPELFGPPVNPEEPPMKVTPMRMPQWSDDPAELADLWRWLDDRGWPDDGARAPDVPYFLENAHKWADARKDMISERRAA